MASRDPRLPEGFIRAVLAELPKWRDRRLWILGKSVRVRWRRLPPFGPVGPLYGEAKLCYIVGAFRASVAMAMAAIEALLRTLTGLKGLASQIDEARRSGLVSDVMANRLHYLRSLVRNPVAHGSEEVSLHGELGGVLTHPGPGENLYESPPGRDLLTPEDAAKEALEAFLELVEEDV